MPSKFLLTLLFAAIFTATHGQADSSILLFVGTYTGGVPGDGIYIYEFDPGTGQLKQTGHAEHLTNPSFLTISPNGQYLYACTDTKLPGQGSVSAFGIDSVHGSISFINKQPSGGENPVYLSVYRNNKFLVNGNYTAGNVSVFTVNKDGSLNPYSQLIPFTDSGINKIRQDKAHIHATVFSPGQDLLFFPDLGSDKIRVFRFDSSRSEPLLGTDHTVRSVSGSGPRHFTFHPNGRYAYCIEELGGMVSAYAYGKGKLDSIQRIFSYSKTQESYGSSDIHISPDGLFLYASNRWVDENTLSIFAIDPDNGKLTLLAHQPTFGEHPRNFVIDPTGNFLLVANLVTNNIVVFKRDLKTGLLTRTKTEIHVPGPSCLQMRRY